MTRRELSLSLVNPKQVQPGFDLRLELALEGRSLEASFTVRTPVPAYVNPDLTNLSSQWGLWDWDVVELFVAVSDDCYYEFQVSPLGQFFELKIYEPRKRFDRDYHCEGAAFTAPALSPGLWSARFLIPLDELGWDGDPASVRGNAFAILGVPENKTYWSAFLPQQEQPDFHLPEKFQPLFASRK